MAGKQNNNDVQSNNITNNDENNCNTQLQVALRPLTMHFDKELDILRDDGSEISLEIKEVFMKAKIFESIRNFTEEYTKKTVRDLAPNCFIIKLTQAINNYLEYGPSKYMGERSCFSHVIFKFRPKTTYLDFVQLTESMHDGTFRETCAVMARTKMCLPTKLQVQPQPGEDPRILVADINMLTLEIILNFIKIVRAGTTIIRTRDKSNTEFKRISDWADAEDGTFASGDGNMVLFTSISKVFWYKSTNHGSFESIPIDMDNPEHQIMFGTAKSAKMNIVHMAFTKFSRGSSDKLVIRAEVKGIQTLPRSNEFLPSINNISNDNEAESVIDINEVSEVSDELINSVPIDLDALSVT